MPFPDDPALMKTAGELVQTLKDIFHTPPGFRPGPSSPPPSLTHNTTNFLSAHAKGLLLKGTFTPSPTAAKLSIAPHFNTPSTPVRARFSNSTGIPVIPDTDPNADPRGIGLRFILGDHKHTDIIAHSTPYFPVRTGEEFLAMLRAIATSGPDTTYPKPIEKFLGENPSALKFVQAPKPAPESYGREMYWGVNAYKLINSSNKATFIRYQIVPVAGISTLSTEELATKSPNYLQDELKERLEKGTIEFKILAQVAGDGDVTDDATVHWPEEREVVELGSFRLDGILEDGEGVAKKTIFDPVPRVRGVEASADPLLEMRAALYLISGRERRAA
jgi:catalase